MTLMICSMKIGSQIIYRKIRKPLCVTRCRSGLLRLTPTNLDMSTFTKYTVSGHLSCYLLTHQSELVQSLDRGAPRHVKPKELRFKVGRTGNLRQRLHDWNKQCPSKENVLCGWWPGIKEAEDGITVIDLSSESNFADIDPGERGPFTHRLERLVQLELADLAVNAPYLNPDSQKIEDEPSDDSSDDYFSNANSPATPLRKNGSKTATKVKSPSTPKTPQSTRTLRENREKCQDCELFSCFIIL